MYNSQTFVGFTFGGGGIESRPWLTTALQNTLRTCVPPSLMAESNILQWTPRAWTSCGKKNWTMEKSKIKYRDSPPFATSRHLALFAMTLMKLAWKSISSDREGLGHGTRRPRRWRSAPSPHQTPGIAGRWWDCPYRPVQGGGGVKKIISCTHEKYIAYTWKKKMKHRIHTIKYTFNVLALNGNPKIF